MKMSSPLLLAIGAVVIGFLILIAWILQPAPSPAGFGPQMTQDDVRANIKGTLDQITCEVAVPTNANLEQTWVFPSGKADKVIIDTGTISHIFDVGSSRTAEAHDQLILPEEPPSEIAAKRNGSALILCDKQRLGVVIIRQYCVSKDGASPWNNEIEEIDFPKYGEVWLSDDLYAGVPDPQKFAPPQELLQELRKKYGGFPIQDTWKARRFSEVLPDAPQAALDCRKDFDGVEKFE